MFKKLFRKKKDNEGDSSISAPMEVVHAVHIDKEMNWTFDQSIDPKTIFTKLKVIGKGGFGTVWQIIHRPSMKILAGKLINQTLVQDDNSKEEIQHEIELMREVDSPYTVRYYGCVNFEGSLMILMEYIDRGSLRDILDYREQVLSEDQISCVMSDLLNGLKKIHNDFHILHRDIKAANLLLNSEGRMKLADFGVSRQFEGGGSSQTMTIVGTPYWMAPEVISGIAYSYPADVWSVGITAVELAEGAPPYVEYSPTKAMVEIATKGFPGYRFPQMHSPEFTDFVSHCVVFNQKERWSVERLLEHPFIKRSKGYSRDTVMTDLIKEGAANLGISSSSQLNSTFETGSNISLSKQSVGLDNDNSSSILGSATPLDGEGFNTFSDCANALLSKKLESAIGTFVGPQGEGTSSMVFTPTPENADSTFQAGSGFNSFVGPGDGMSSFVYTPTPDTADSTFKAGSGFDSFASTGNGDGMSSFVYTPTPQTADSTFKAGSGFDSFVSTGNGEGMSSFVYTPTPQTADSTFKASTNVGTFVGPTSNEGMSSFVYTPTPETADSTFKASSDFNSFMASHQNMLNQDHAVVQEDGQKRDRIVTFEMNDPSMRQSLLFEQKDDDTFVITRNEFEEKKKNKVPEEAKEEEILDGDEPVSLPQLDNKAFMQVSRAMSKQIPFSPLLIATNQDAPVETLYMPVDSTMMRKKILPPLFDEDGVINMTAAIRHEKATVICAMALILAAFIFFGSNGFFFLLGVSILTHMSVIFMSKRKERHETIVKRAKEARAERNKRKVELAQQKKNKKMGKIEPQQ